MALVLWTMAVLSAVALQIAFSCHLRAKTSSGLGQGMRALFIARAGVERTVADLTANANSTQSLADFRDSEMTAYQNVECGDGTFTLYAGYDEEDRPVFGIMDESAKLNVNTAEGEVLGKLPGMPEDVLADLIIAREESAFRDVHDLLRLEKMEPAMLFGEDRNGNGLLDSNEDDGNRSWPPDNEDGHLDIGLAAYLTTWSASRNLNSEGEKPVDINSADADKLKESVPDLTQEEAQAIIDHRGQSSFKSIVELLDVNVKAQGGGQAQKAFDESRLKEIADYVTTLEDDVANGLININTVGKDVLLCLPGMSEELVTEIIRTRSQRQDPFKSVVDLLDVEGMTVDTLKQVCPLLTVRTDVLSARSFGVLDRGDTCRVVEAVIDRTGDNIVIRSWREIE